jgi:hypothetical protein
LALEGARVGDEIWLAKGARVPVVLRPEGEKKRLGAEVEEGGLGPYRFVGDAYVHGVMYGECFEPERCGQVSII